MCMSVCSFTLLPAESVCVCVCVCVHSLCCLGRVCLCVHSLCCLCVGCLCVCVCVPTWVPVCALLYSVSSSKHTALWCPGVALCGEVACQMEIIQWQPTLS